MRQSDNLMNNGLSVALSLSLKELALPFRLAIFFDFASSFHSRIAISSVSFLFLAVTLISQTWT